MASQVQLDPQRSENRNRNPHPLQPQPEIATLTNQIQALTEQNQNLLRLLAERLPPQNGNPQITHPHPINPLIPPPQPSDGHPPRAPCFSEADNQQPRIERPDQPNKNQPYNCPSVNRREEQEATSNINLGTGRRGVGGNAEYTEYEDSQLKALKNQLDSMQKEMRQKEPPTMAEMVMKTGMPFRQNVMDKPLPPKFKLPTLKQFDGTTDPVDHLEAFRSFMILHGTPDEIMCRAFPTTLTGSARVWFSNIPSDSISLFAELGVSFVSHFIGGQKYRKPATHLITIKQKEGETLRKFVSRFNGEAVLCDGVDDKVSVTAMMGGLRDSSFLFSLHKKPPTSMGEMMARAQKYINAEDATVDKKESSKEAQQGESRKRKEMEREAEARVKNVSRFDGPRARINQIQTPIPRTAEYRPRPQPPRALCYQHYTPLTTTREQILMQIRGYPEIKWPAPLSSSPSQRDPRKYCHFHRDHGHETSECFQLKNQIEELIRNGKLGRYVQGIPRREDNRIRKGGELQPVQQGGRPEQDPQHQGPPIGEIRVISGGMAGGGDSSAQRKAYIRKIRTTGEVPESEFPNKIRRAQTPLIVFEEGDADGVHQPHDDPLVVSALISNYNIHRVLVDNGSSADVLFFEAFMKLGLDKAKLSPVRSPLVGFAGDQVMPIGSVLLPVTLGTRPLQSTKMIDFLIVDCPSAYNAILGRSALNKFMAVTSTYHLVIKFPVGDAVGEVKGSQRAARECYVASLKQPVEKEALIIDTLEVRDEEELRMGEPAEELLAIEIYENDPKKVVKVGSTLSLEDRTRYANLFMEFKDVFAWTHEDMPGIKKEIACHQLNADPRCRAVRQKQRNFAQERNQAIAVEVEKLLKANFIREVAYPEWISNVVLVAKSNGKWRMCVDFTDLNRACPKDGYPLPRIDLLVDATAGHEMLSFMDAFSGYNQILMAEQDQEKTAFITDRGLYCYRVMPFGLKNAGATYQRLVNKMFKNQIGRNVEVYVDDMLVKSKQATEHLGDLRETFQTLRSYGMKLNPEKCAFGVGSGKFLGYMVSRRGIEANPEKIEAILRMQAPRRMQEVQRLTGRVVALNRFISRATDKCLPFFKVLKKSFEWTDECDKAFADLKQYLTSPPLLARTVRGEDLFVYLAVSEAAVSAVLVKKEEGRQKPVFYISRILRDAETRYSALEKLALALITASRRLKPYFEAHPIMVITDQPLKKVLQKPEISGRLMAWAVELGAFDISYLPRTSVKGQVLADFIVELTPTPISVVQTETSEDGSGVGGDTSATGSDGSFWEINVDGSSREKASGAGIVLQTPDGITLECVLLFGFGASNNEAEYEALIAGLEMAHALGAKDVRVYSDSQLVVGQVKGGFEVKEDHLARYREKVRELQGRFRSIGLTQIPREENQRADRLAKLSTTEGESFEEGIFVGHLTEPATGQERERVIMQIKMSGSWAEPIERYLRNGDLPEDKNEARKVKFKAARYTMMGEDLYKRGYSQPYLKCITLEEGDYVLKEIHLGVCGNHSGGRSLAHKALRTGYYWPTMSEDARKLVQKCDKCQRFGPVPRMPASDQVPILSPCPFDQWGLDLVGPLPPGKGQCKYAIVAIDYFTKWVEAGALDSITERNTTRFVWQAVVCRFGVPRVIITDNGKQFDNNKFRAFATELGIEIHYASPAHPQSNGQVEVTNRTLLTSVKKKLEGAKKLWVDQLPEILWAYRTTTRTPTGETPFSLTYGAEAVLPVEVGLLTQRMSCYDRDSNELARNAELDLLEERRESASIRMAAYKQQVRRYHDRKVRRRGLTVGDLVLREVTIATRNPQEGKLGPTWEGPYVVKSRCREGTYKLQTMEGKELPHPWNMQHLKKYYQ